MIKNNNAVATLFLGIILGLTVYGAVYETHSPRGGGLSGQPLHNAHAAVAARDTVYHRLPLYFEANRGQAPTSVRFLSRGPDYGLYLTSSGPVLALYHHRLSAAPARVSMKLMGSNDDARMSGRHRQRGTVNYIKGNDPRHWQRGIPVYDQVAYSSVYPGIDLVFHGRGDQLEYDFKVAPSADPGAIRMAFSGVDNMRLDRAGRLHLITRQGEVIQQAPVAYQMIGGARHPVASRYVMHADQQVAFAVAGYDPRRALIIDPILSFSTFFGGGGDDRGWAVARDATDDSIYVTGRTASIDFPATLGDTNCGSAVDCRQNQITDTFTGATLDASKWTAVGSVTQNDNLTVTTAAAANDRAGVTTTAALQSNFDAHVSLSGLNEASKLTGIAVHVGLSTYTFEVSSSTSNQDYTFADGSSCTGTTAIATSAANFEGTAELRVVRTGTTLSFMAYSPANPILKTYVLVGTCSGVSSADATLQLFTETADGTAKTSVFDDFYATESNGSPDAFVMRLDNGGTSLSYATYLGGSNEDEGLAVAAGGGAAYVTGRTYSADFPVTAGAYDTQCPDTNGDGQCDNGADAFVAKLDSAGSVAYATYLGGCYDDAANAIAVDAGGNAYVGGYTESAPDTATSSTNATCVDEFPLVNAIQSANKGRKDAFVTKLNATGSALIYSTFLGGAYADEVLGIAVSSSGEAYVTGYTASSDFPLVNPLQPAMGSTTSYDAFVAEINAAGNALVYSTYLGGSAYDYGQSIAVDSAGNAYVAGWTRSTDFPTASPIQSANGGSYDAFVSKLNPAGSALIYSTYLGGVDTEEAQGIAVDAGGNAVITGYTTSQDFLISLLRDVRPDLVAPLTTLNNLDNYVMNNLSTDDLAQALVQLDTSLDLTAMQALTRSDLIGRIFSVVDGYLVSDLNAIQTNLSGSSDAIVVKLDSAGSIAEATLLGGGDEDYGTGIALDASGNPIITGYTVTNPLNSASGLPSGLSQAQNFPVTSNAASSLSDASSNSVAGKEEDGFIAKIDDGSVDVGVTLAADPSGAVAPDTNVTYTATVSNQGTTTAEGVVLTNTLYDGSQIGLNLVSASAQQGSCTPSAADITKFTHIVTCRLGALAAGASTTVTVVATAVPAFPPDTPQKDLPTDHVSVTALGTNSSSNSSSNSSAESSNPVNVNVPPAAERTCDFNATKPTGCTVPKLGAFGPCTLAVLMLGLAAGAWRRRRIGQRSGM